MPGTDVDKTSPEYLWSEPKMKEVIELWELTPSDTQKLFILKAKLKNVHHLWNSPDVIMGFVSTGGWETAEQRFRKMIQWRLDNKVDALLTEFKPNPLILDNSCVAFLKNYDHQGDPIYLERGGALDVKGLLKRFPREELMRHAIWLREVQCNGAWLDEYERRQGRGVRSITVVYDLKDLSTRHLHPNVLGFFQELMQLTDDYYPGPIKRMIIIRAPHIFRFAWKTIKGFFSEESQSKMIFADSDYLAELGKWMDVDVLPQCINPDGHGETAIGMPKYMQGGQIPDHIGEGGVGYHAVGSGLSEASSPADDSSTDESASEEEVEQLMAGLHLTQVPAKA
ncbi:SEC14-like protein [Seminavis robusta]|uniref:SEC14-like protein n=1 Tax=Seminavis robusta TaxID=568900 RepID=A0A9N8E874_9STRA|nr:SEC14-like protein [Seminavis robusta]|eukprot:Sro652_g181670.1 SEC14-like protein (339) ;mRNA; r:5287-6396